VIRTTKQVVQPAFTALALLCLSLLLGCSTTGGTRLPPVTATATNEALVGKFVWFDLLTEDVAAAKTFYAELFGWQIDDSAGPKGYSVIRNGGSPIGGIANISDELEESEAIWLASLSVDDVDKAAQVTRDRGGEVLDGPADVTGRGRMVVLRDPTGAELIALRSSSGDPPDVAAGPGSWLWVDLVTHDSQAARDYYAALVGYQSKQVKSKHGETYHIFGRGDRVRAGVVEVDWEKIESNWLPYVSVADVDATVVKAESLGAKQILRDDRLAVLLDPTGAAFGVHLAVKGQE
jgi:predicted enzyme related to lactoylglutathione lyase